jgi:hypothetical protein
VFCRPHWGSDKKFTVHPYRVEAETASYLRAGAKSISFYETAAIIDRVEFSRAIRRINFPEAMPSRVV